MAQPFDIKVDSNTLNLDNAGHGTKSFTVKNLTGRRVHATVTRAVTPDSGAAWAKLQPPLTNLSADGGEGVLDFAIDATQTITVELNVPLPKPIPAPPATTPAPAPAQAADTPPEAKPGTYTLSITVADDVNPDDNFTPSPDVVFTVPEPQIIKPNPFPVWIIPAIIIVVLVIIAIIAVVVVNNNNAAAAATADFNNTGTAAVAGTAGAFVHQTETQAAIDTLTAIATETAVAQQTADHQTQVAGQTITANAGIATQVAGQTATQAVRQTGTSIVKTGVAQALTATACAGNPLCGIHFVTLDVHLNPGILTAIRFGAQSVELTPTPTP